MWQGGPAMHPAENHASTFFLEQDLQKYILFVHHIFQ